MLLLGSLEYMHTASNAVGPSAATKQMLLLLLVALVTHLQHCCGSLGCHELLHCHRVQPVGGVGCRQRLVICSSSSRIANSQCRWGQQQLAGASFAPHIKAATLQVLLQLLVCPLSGLSLMLLQSAHR
jgi:hypothetical protein